MKRIIFIGLALIIAAVAFKFCTYKKQYNELEGVRVEIAESLIRFHVRANSDSEEDQNLKLKVKDRIIRYLSKELAAAGNLDEARDILYYDIDAIKKIALDVIEKEGYNYSVKAYFEHSYFPVKEYGDMSFPAGEYEAFRVDIGEAEGKNWWCVLFPPLCFVDSTYMVVPDDTKQLFKENLSEKAYDTITMKDLKNNSYEVGFKYLKFLNYFLK